MKQVMLGALILAAVIVAFLPFVVFILPPLLLAEMMDATMRGGMGFGTRVIGVFIASGLAGLVVFALRQRS